MRPSSWKVDPEDGLVEGLQAPGYMILNHGDPTFSSTGPQANGLSTAEALFLRIVAYLPFAEVVCLPVRYMLASDSTFEAVRLAERLLREGVLRPERRAEASSFEEVAVLLGLPEAARGRGQWLDGTALAARSFHSLDLSAQYRKILLDDLGEDGGFRRTLSSALLRDSQQGLQKAEADYAAVIDGTPEAYWRTVRANAPKLDKQALKWAMARYYTTPTLFDSLNTREIPTAASDLLVRGKIIDPTMRPLDLPAPAEHLHSQLMLALPVEGVSLFADEYCRAALEVRQRIPEARSVFKDVRQRAALAPLTDEVNHLFAEELAKQKRVNQNNGWTITIATALGGSGVGAFVGGSAEIATGVGLATGVAGRVIEDRIGHWRQRNKRPWLLASELFVREVGNRENR